MTRQPEHEVLLATMAIARHLEASGDDSVTMTFAEIDQLLGGMPDAASRSTGWWSNEADGYPLPRPWLIAGFRVAAVELGTFVRFERVRGRVVALEVVGLGAGEPVVTGGLEVRDRAVVADDGGAWLLADDFAAVLPDGAHAYRVSPSAGEPFLVACWFSLRGVASWGRLVGPAGRVLSREEAFALVDACACVGRAASRGRPDELDGSWTSVPLRVPGRQWDPDAAFVPFVPEAHLMDPDPTRAGGYAYPDERRPRATKPRARPQRPADTAWVQGRTLDPACARRGMRVFDDFGGTGTVLAVEPMGRKTELLVGFDNGHEARIPFIFLEFPDGPDLVARDPDAPW